MGMLGREPSSAQLAYLGSCARSPHELRQSTKTGLPEIFRKWTHGPAIYAGGRFGILGSMGARLSALIPVESREVRPGPSRPGSFFPCLNVHSSPRLVPGVCASISGRGFFIGFSLLDGRLDHRDGDKARSEALDDDFDHLRGSLPDGLLDRGLHLLRRILKPEGFLLEIESYNAVRDSEHLQAEARFAQRWNQLLNCLLYALFKRDRMNSIERENAADHGIRGELGEPVAPAVSAVFEQFQYARDGGTMQIHDRLHKFEGRRPRLGIGERAHAPDQLIDSSGVELEFLMVHFAPIMPNMGECRVSSTLPLPRYMWTPQGRQGSKLRTARMMSMPLNLSGPFSSKIGVFCTASS